MVENIKDLLPHREPFLFVDKLEKCDKEEIIGSHVFTEKEFFFAGHFPEYPVVPGVVLVEAMAQCGGAGIKHLNIMEQSALFFLASIEKAKFRRQVVPNDEVRFVIENIRLSPRMIKQRGKAYVGDELACEAEWLCLVGSAE
ncbi:MAG: 3-hydroxyacyl-ACP dehydratase FabZ [Spirochaeta sp.]|nr:3-hydroxyacyl-ACP dehydratase FabZ [Spirochaeta sp.]